MTDDRKRLIPRLRELDDELEARPMQTAAHRRVFRAIAARAAPQGFRRRWLPAMSFAAGAALVITVFALRWQAGDQRFTELQRLASPIGGVGGLGGFDLQGDRCNWRESNPSSTVLHGDCRLVAAHMSAQTWETAEVDVEGRELTVRKGHVVVQVRKVPAGQPPVKVAVSHGVIEVLGTKFSIEQFEDGGHVDLFEGSIRFRDADGEVVEIEPGQRYEWGRRAELARNDIDGVADDDLVIEPVLETSDRRRSLDPSEATAVIQQVGTLRSAGRYRQAVSLLEEALQRPWDRRTAQVLSYELGELLARHLGDSRAACRHLARHQVRYPGGRYASAIDQTQRRLDCDHL